MSEEGLTLSALNARIKDATEHAFPKAIWVVAEILELNINRSGHCYLDLVEKEQNGEGILAKSRATIWSFKFRLIRPYFETTTGEELRAGIKVLLKANVSFHEIYGMSLNIVDIDPSFTMGDMALKRREIIARLEKAGVMDMNKELEMTQVPQRIAVISSETAAGLGDFLDSLVNNAYGFSFQVSLFPAIVQGDQAEDSMIQALEKIFTHYENFDVVALIRGGGSQADLECFNAYELAFNIAQFPLPVITGIGHEKDESIADMVAYKHLKTPTAVAEYLVDQAALFSEYLMSLQDQFKMMIRDRIQQEQIQLREQGIAVHTMSRQQLFDQQESLNERMHTLEKSIFQQSMKEKNRQSEISQKLVLLSRSYTQHRERDIETMSSRIGDQLNEFLKKENEKMKSLSKSLDLMRPENVLKRGYSITYVKGKVIKSVRDAVPGNRIQTHLRDGRIDSTIDQLESDED